MTVRNTHVSMLRQAGLSLVEVMIALTIGTILTVGVVQLFVANSETYSMLVGQSRVQENARFALEFVSRSARMAGYKGCFSVNGDVGTTLTLPTDVPYEFNIAEKIDGFEGVGDGLWLPAISNLPETAGVDTSFVAGNGVPTDTIKTGTAAADQTDVLVIRKISNTESRLALDMATPSDNVIVTKPAGGLDFGCAGCTPNKAWDDLVLIYDCEKSMVFRVTQVSDGVPAAGQATIEHGVSEVDATRNNQTSLADYNTYEGLDAGVAAIVTDIFYVAPGAGVNNVGDTPWSLWRKSGVSKPVELIEGIEDLQVEYGIDSDNDGIPNQYVKASGITTSKSVLTVRVEIVANSVDDVGSSQADGLMRRTFSQTMQIRNKG